ncbi:MAG: 3'(2'),5'-bisphosphate nucleotidase CysQ, partial [Planctomycetota bacterium]|nr:3'(2'),5'-bisphosphate nucleotidase CysQ [Planctomycetota bacterium]
NLARSAGAVVMQVAREGFEQSRKDDKSLVTTADLKSNEHILNGLQDAFPDDGILTEESGTLGNTDSDLLWVVDPVDGTRAFARQIPGFSVMIGLLHKEQPVIGVVYDPLEDWLYYAAAGEGAFAVSPGTSEPERVRVSKRSEGGTMPLISSPGLDEEVRKDILSKGQLIEGTLINSVGIKVGLLVRQAGDVYFNYHSVSYWDTVAPLLIAREAGAQASMLDGRPFEYDLSDPKLKHQGPSLVTNGTRHKVLRETIASIVDD